MKTCGMFDDDQPDKFFGLPSRVRADGGGVLLLPRPPTPRGGGGVIIFLYHDPYNFES